MNLHLTENQKTVIRIANDNGGVVTKKQVCEVIRYYYNTEKHVGDILSRMVKKNILKRIKPGVFEISTGNKQEEPNPNQISIFD